MMIQEKYKPYPKYKPSGVEWIGEIPEKWEVRRLTTVLKDLESGGREKDSVEIEDGAISIGGEHVGWNGELLIENPRYASMKYYYSMKKGKVNNGDVLLVKDGATIGKTAYVISLPKQAALNEHVFLLRGIKNTIEQRYLFFFIFCSSGQEQINMSITGSAQPGLNRKFKLNTVLCLPPLPEQQAIADFLDRETARINSIVEKQIRKIELLKEKRSALITHTVTKGLDPKAKMKDSGVEWIGEIPEGWEVKRLRSSVKYNLETLSENTTNPNYEIEYLDISNVDGDGNIISTETLLFRDAPSRARRVVKNGNTIISTVRTYLKAIAYLNKIPDNLIVSTGFAVIESVKPTNSKYLFYFIRSEYFIQNVTKNSKGVSYPAITPSQSPGNLIDIVILLPPLSEQQVIATFLDREAVKIDTLIGKIEKQKELLSEYKQSLITHAVTGKIDVRGEAYAQNS